MKTPEIKRKLTAILSADVEGYSRLMGEDEIATIRTLMAYRDAMTNLILLHRGRVVDAPGDNMLAEFAVAGNPNSADDMARLGLILLYAGNPQEGIASLKKAIRLNPIPPSWYLSSLGWAYGISQQYDEAIIALNKSLRFSPDSINAWQGLTLAYSLSGNISAARTAVENVLQIEPRFSIGYFAEMLPFKNRADTDLVINALRSAGLN